jgi:UDP-N-acetylmuramoyl-tripeptide--D-alanyl-D-alanine ligase
MRSLVGLPANALRVARTRSKKLISRADRQLSLWRASYARKRSAATFIGVTGSSGKSTTTALIAHILQSGAAPVRAQVATSLLRFHVAALREVPSEGYFVGELNSRGPRTLKPLIDIFKPQIGVVTLVRLEHKSRFRTLDAVTEEKGLLVEALPANGLAVLNFDDPRVASMARRTKARSVTFGETGGDYVISNVRSLGLGDLRLKITHQNSTFEVASSLTGAHASMAVAAAFACTHQLGVSPAAILERIASFGPLFGRCSVHRVHNGPVFLVDTVKAPHHSIQLALDMMGNLSAPRKRIVIGQLSDFSGSNQIYPKVYRAALSVADQVIFVGQHSHRSKATAEDIAKGRFVRFETVEEAGKFLSETAIADEIICLKSSIQLHLERLMINFFTPVRCWIDDCGRIDTCAALLGGGCGLYEVPFEQHKTARKQLVHPLPPINFG